MGADYGWDKATFRQKSSQIDGKGKTVENMCLGCDAFFKEALSDQLKTLRTELLAATL